MKALERDRFVGQTVSNYEVECLLGRGRMSVVYRAQQLQSQQFAAITLFQLPEEIPVRAHQQFRERFLQYGPKLKAVSHANLLPLYSYGVWEEQPYLITPYRTEGSLAATLQQAYTPVRALRVLEQVVAGLECAHRSGLVHGMLTPAYLLVAREEPIQVAGLGLLHLMERRGILPIEDASQYQLTVAGTVLAAQKYLAVEYLQGREVDIRSDVYSLGVILLELLRGALLPQDINPLDQLMREERILSRELRNVLSRALASDPRQRFSRVSDLLTAFASAVEQEKSTEAEAQRSSQFLTPEALPAIQPETQDREPAEKPFTFEPIPWQTTPPGQLLPLVATSIASSSQVGKYTERTQKPGGISRRKVIAVLAAGLVVGVVGVGTLSSLTNQAGGQAPAATTHVKNEIGDTKLAVNTALAFNNPGDTNHRQSLLVHLPGGNFVAYKQGCTHSGVLVDYDPKTQMLVCPAHGAIFDPAHGARVMKGPGNDPASSITPLPSLSIRVNGDGTIVRV